MEGTDLLRAIFSFGGLILFWTIGLVFPFRKSFAFRDFNRWLTNLIFSFGNGLLIFLLIPISLETVNLLPWAQGLGFFSIKGFGPPIQYILGWVILDFSMYWQHRFSHLWNWFWKLHRVHHSDIEIDTTSGGRFHTFESFLSFGFKLILVILFEIPVESILFFAILLNFCALFNHSNFKVPTSLEKPLRYLIITPDLHRIHHSVIGEEMNTNFGFSISLWDRLFGTFRSEASSPQKDMKIGLDDFRLKKDQTLFALLAQPFKK